MAEYVGVFVLGRVLPSRALEEGTLLGRRRARWSGFGHGRGQGMGLVWGRVRGSGRVSINAHMEGASGVGGALPKRAVTLLATATSA